MTKYASKSAVFMLIYTTELLFLVAMVANRIFSIADSSSRREINLE
jgi:hypothetical protein